MMFGVVTQDYQSICRIRIFYILLMLLIIQACDNHHVEYPESKKVSKNMKGNIARPEPVLFLELAAEAMDKYKTENSTYPKEWYQLKNFSFGGGPYYVGDEGTKPKAEDGNAWQPRDCQYTYVIVSSGDDEYRIVAVDQDGEEVYELTQAMKTPKLLIKSKVPKSEIRK